LHNVFRGRGKDKIAKPLRVRYKDIAKDNGKGFFFRQGYHGHDGKRVFFLNEKPTAQTIEKTHFNTIYILSLLRTNKFPTDSDKGVANSIPF